MNYYQRIENHAGDMMTVMTMTAMIYRWLWWRFEQVGYMLTTRCILSVSAELVFYDPSYFVIQQFAQLTYNYDFLTAGGQGWY